MIMKKQVGEALILAAMIGGAYGGYKLGEGINSETPEAVAAAQAEFEQAEAGYIALGSVACEQGALAGLSVSVGNYYAAPKSADTTASALVVACPDMSSQSARQLGNEASNYFVETVEPARGLASSTERNSDYTFQEKLALTVGPVNLISFFTLGAGYLGVNSARRRIRIAKKQRSGGGITSEDLGIA